MNQKVWRWAGIALLSAALILGGCNVSIPKTTLDQTAISMVRTIAVVEVREPEQYGVVSGGHPGLLFGAIGGAIAGASMERNGVLLTSAIRSTGGHSLGRQLTDSIVRSLQQAGYEVHRVPDIRGPENNEFSLDYAKIRTDAEAVLNVTLKSASYVSIIGADDYAPQVEASAELVNANKGQQRRLYFDRFWLGKSDPSNPDYTYVASPAQYRFASVDDLIKRAPEAGAGLQASVDSIGQRIAQELGRRP